MRGHFYLPVVRSLVLGFSLLAATAATAEPPATQPAWTPRLQFRAVADPDEKGDADELVDPADGKPIHVLKEVHLNERDLARVYGKMDQGGAITVGMEFTDAGAARAERFTTANVHRRVAIVLDGKVLTAPNVQTPFRTAAEITGGRPGFTRQQADELVKQIRDAMRQAPTTRP